MKIKPIFIFLSLCSLFIAYTAFIYFTDLNKHEIGSSQDLQKSAEGKLLWQKHNCQSCHQIYSLGGYLGPDLTNVYSKYEGNPHALGAFFNGGFKQMPKFNFTEKENELFVAFFRELDNTGKADHRTFKIGVDGMIRQDGKD